MAEGCRRSRVRWAVELVSCSSSCLTQDHENWGSCVRSKGLHIEGCRDAVGGSDRTKQKAWDKELGLYRSAAAQGISPKSTKTYDIQTAIELSDKAGEAYDAGAPPPPYKEG